MSSAPLRADVVVPNSTTATEGDSTFSLTTVSGGTGRTYQMSIAAGQLIGEVGQQITGMKWRLDGPATAAWPSVDTNFASFNVFVGPGLAPGTTSATFASNFTAASTQVRSGALTILAGSFTSGFTPNTFGPALTFTTPYLYTGGNLTIELRMTQQSGATTQSPFDGESSLGGPGNGWGVDFSARFANDSTATTATVTTGNFLVTNLITSGVPEPSSLALVGLSIAAVAVWKKRRRRPWPAASTSVPPVPTLR
jgi:hypothetical protein